MTNLVNNFKNLISNELFLKLLGYLDEKDALLKKRSRQVYVLS